MSDNDFTQLKHEIAKAYPGFEQNATSAWASIVEELGRVTVDIAKLGPDYIPIIDFSNLRNISPDQLEELKRKGSFVIRNVVPQSEAQAWRQGLLDFVNANPNAEGTPAENPQYFQIFYTKPQVQARAHPNVLATQTWCNSLYSSSSTTETVDLDAPLTYVDRFRMRQPGFAWSAHPPHMDGGSIERWLDPTFRSCFESILKGNWREYNPYSLKGRIGARTSSKGLPNQASIFRTFQGWMAISETAPNQGTLQVFPDVLLSTSYIMLRPFFTPTLSPSEDGYLNAENWKFDLTSPIFHGVSQSSTAGAAGAARPFGFSPETHPHLDLDKTMVSVPPVRPGDMVFWHCDVVHAVESEHTGAADSSVMYIPAVPKCTQNDQYVDKQLAHFLKGYPPPDFPQGRTELDYNLHATDEDLTSPQARKAMGLA